jgi:hypothetical protein
MKNVFQGLIVFLFFGIGAIASFFFLRNNAFLRPSTPGNADTAPLSTPAIESPPQDSTTDTGMDRGADTGKSPPPSLSAHELRGDTHDSLHTGSTTSVMQGAPLSADTAPRPIEKKSAGNIGTDENVEKRTTRSGAAAYTVTIPQVQCRIGETNTIFVLFSLHVDELTREEKQTVLLQRDRIRSRIYSAASRLNAATFSIPALEKTIARIVRTYRTDADTTHIRCTDISITRQQDI